MVLEESDFLRDDEPEEAVAALPAWQILVVDDELGIHHETRSNETGNHVRRVAEISDLLALQLGLSDHEAHVLRIASPMRDIGKIELPDDLLNKPGKLDPAAVDACFARFEEIYHIRRKDAD